MPTERVVVFTHATSPYFRFVAPFIYFWLKSNSDVAVEVVVEKFSDYSARHSAEVDMLRAIFPDRHFNIRGYALDLTISPNTRRFIDVPSISGEYVYITDVDILILDNDVAAQHIQNMRQLGVPYSNIQRAGAKRLSGLHFSSFDRYYPIPDLSDVNLETENDEAVLYQIIERKGLQIVQGSFRPIHGIHVSLHRPPFLEGGDIYGWGLSAPYLKHLSAIISSSEFIAFEATTHPGFRNILDRLRSAIRVSEQKQLSPATQAFTAIFRSNEWGSTISRSGPGSTWAATKKLRHNLRLAFQELSIRSLVDAACGDANWIVEALEGIDVYIGIDIVPDLVASNAVFHAERNMSFRRGDITSDPLPKADAVLCRDCLVHLPFAMGIDALFRFSHSEFKYLLTTTFTELVSNSDTERPGPWRPLNLTRPPFNLPPPLKILRERNDGDNFADKSIGIWRISDLRSQFGHTLRPKPHGS